MHTVGAGCIIWAALRPPFVLCLLTTCHPSCRNSLLHCGLQSVTPLVFFVVFSLVLSVQPPASCPAAQRVNRHLPPRAAIAANYLTLTPADVPKDAFF